MEFSRQNPEFYDAVVVSNPDHPDPASRKDGLDALGSVVLRDNLDTNTTVANTNGHSNGSIPNGPSRVDGIGGEVPRVGSQEEKVDMTAA